MISARELLDHAGGGSVDTSFRIGHRRYHVFAFPTPGPRRPSVRWNLYEVLAGREERLRGLTFGLATSVNEALEAVVRVAQRHEQTGEVERDPQRGAFTFRPLPSD